MDARGVTLRFMRSSLGIACMAAIILGVFLMLQFDRWPAADAALEGRCSGRFVAIAVRSSQGLGDERWSRRTTYVCMPSYFWDPVSFSVSASSERPVQVVASYEMVPYLGILALLAWVVRRVLSGRKHGMQLKTGPGSRDD